MCQIHDKDCAESSGRTLIIKSANNSFEVYYNRKIVQGGVDVCTYEELAPIELWNDSSKLGIALLKYVISSAWRNKIKKYDRIIIFNYYGRSVVLPILLLKKHSARVYFWEWNTLGKVRKNLLIRLIERIIPIYTFDPKDAAVNHWYFNQQFYFPSNEVSLTNINNKRAFFVGADKGRYSLLAKIKSCLEPLGISCDFWIVKDATTPCSAKKELIHKNGLAYNEVLDHISKSDILVDIVKEGQEGLTLRALEAFFYGKKIITNNDSIKKIKLYNPSRILILDSDFTSERLYSFINSNFLPYSKEELKEFSFYRWINRFH